MTQQTPEFKVVTLCPVPNCGEALVVANTTNVDSYGVVSLYTTLWDVAVSVATHLDERHGIAKERSK